MKQDNTMKERKQTFTDWKNEPSVSDLKQNLDDAKADHNDHILNLTRWTNNLRVTGSAKPTEVAGQSSVVPKVIRRQAEWRYPALSEPFLATPDIFNVEPLTAGDKNRAIQNALVLNNQFNHKIDKVDFIDSYVRDAVDLGTVIVEVGWETEEETVTEEEPVFEFTLVEDPMQQQLVGEQYMQLIQLRMTNQDAYMDNFDPGIDQALDYLIEYQKVVTPQQVGVELVEKTIEIKNQPTVEVCEQQNLVIDPSCKGNIDKAGFVGKNFKTCLADLEKDGRYSNLDHINIDGASPESSDEFDNTDNDPSFNFTDKARKKFIATMYYGFWDINDNKVLEPILATWVGDTIIRLEELPFPDKQLPFITVSLLPVRNSTYGEPDGELLEDNQKIIGALTRGSLDLMGKSANSQTGFKKGLLDVTNRRKFNRGDDYEFNSNEDPRQGIYAHTYPEIPASVFNMISLQNTDAESLSGVKAYHTGITGQALGNNVTNGRSALDAASKREMAILRRLSNGVIKIGRKIIAMNAEFLSEEEVIRITNNQFIQVRRDDLAGQFDLTLLISTPEEDNTKAQELAFMLQTIGNSLDLGLSKIILSDIANLRKMPVIAKRIAEFEPQPDPLEQMEKQLKLELLKTQIAKEAALAQKHAAEAEMNGAAGMRDITQAALNAAKTQTEQAKTRQISSDTDKKDLEYLEQEGGITQARELEKIDRKAMHETEKQILQ